MKKIIGIILGMVMIAGAFAYMDETTVADEGVPPTITVDAPLRIESNANFDILADFGNGAIGSPWVIENRVIDGTSFGYGIFISNLTGSNTNFIIRNCIVTNATGGTDEVFFPNAGLVLYEVKTGTIENCTFRNNGVSGALLYNNVRQCTFVNSSFLDNGEIGIETWNSRATGYDNITVSGNPVAGALLRGSYGMNFTNSMFKQNGNGFQLAEFTYNINLYMNNITESTAHGILISDANTTQINNNTFINNNCGVNIASGVNNSVYNNRFISNVQQAKETPTGNYWNETYPTGGNYWSDYGGNDLFSGPLQDLPGSDGIGDGDYFIDGDSIDHYPLMLGTTFSTYQPDLMIDGKYNDAYENTPSTQVSWKNLTVGGSVSYAIVAGNDGPSAGLMSMTWIKSIPGTWYATLFDDGTNTNVTNNMNAGTLTFNLNMGEMKNFNLRITSTTSAGFAQDGTINITLTSSSGKDSVSAFAEICEPDELILTSSPGGTPLSTVNLQVGQQITAYASVYNSSNYLGLVPVDWVDSPDLGTFNISSGTSAIFTATGVGTATIFGNSTGLGLKDDFIVQITLTGDSTAPVSSVNAIDGYWLRSSPLTIGATATDDDSGVVSVALWYRFSENNATWEAWTTFGTDTASPWTWAFTFPAGNGYYQFYSIAMDADSNVESAPSSADTVCAFDSIKPTIEDASGVTATTGDNFTVTASIYDNMALHGAHLIYWFGNGTEFNVTMTGTGNTKTYQVSIPLTSLNVLHYIITAVDRAKNWNSTLVKNVTVIDNDPPTADAGPDQTVDAGELLAFDGTGSTDNIGVDNYTWTFTHRDEAVTLWCDEPEYTFWDTGTYTVTLTVSDAAGYEDTDEVEITVENANLPPTADAGDNQTVKFGTQVTFDGANSTDDMGITNYTWTFTYNSTTITIWGVSPEFTFWASGVYDVTLVVRDGGGLTATDTAHIIVESESILASDYCWVAIIICLIIALLLLLLFLKRRKKVTQDANIPASTQREEVFVPVTGEEQIVTNPDAGKPANVPE